MTNVYQVLVFAILLGMKGHVMPVESQCCKVKLNSFITGQIDSRWQRRKVTLGQTRGAFFSKKHNYQS